MLDEDGRIVAAGRRDEAIAEAGPHLLAGALVEIDVDAAAHLQDERPQVVDALTDADQLRTATLVGPFFEGGDSTYTLTLTDYGKPVEITRP